MFVATRFLQEILQHFLVKTFLNGFID